MEIVKTYNRKNGEIPKYPIHIKVIQNMYVMNICNIVLRKYM